MNESGRHSAMSHIEGHVGRTFLLMTMHLAEREQDNGVIRCQSCHGPLQ